MELPPILSLWRRLGGNLRVLRRKLFSKAQTAVWALEKIRWQPSGTAQEAILQSSNRSLGKSE
ncbi:hypothetical protein D5R40_17710 [Okeania hirsuta]|uniref:Uncharacterized protein n=1 Tax=Okeania hirsuta TaxID=1458930 RepID=A0A3N6RM02_9CYAN|nr:hypothetical protein D5R40_17710 [Okeania hirsuta]